MSTVERLMDALTRARIATEAENFREAVMREREAIDAAHAIIDEAVSRMCSLAGRIGAEPTAAASELATLIERGCNIATVERETIRNALKRNNGSRATAAKDLGIGERTLYRKIKEYALEAL